MKFEQKINIINALDKIILLGKKFKVEDTILIAGTPRSGTTWLMEIFENIPKYTYSFEPLNPIWYIKPRELGFQSRIYLPSDMDWAEGEEYLRKIFSGHVIGLYSLNKRTIEEIMHLLLSKKLIVKSIRLNRLLPWIAKRFQLRRIFFIIRHPCATVASQLKTGFTGYHNILPPYADIFPKRENILEEASKIELDPRLLNRLKSIKTKEEILAAAWCLDNYIPLSSPKPYPWTIVTYEKLIKEGKKEIIRVFNEIREKNILRSTFRHLKIPSMLTPGILAPGDEVKEVTKADEQLSKWKKFLSKKQTNRMLTIVSDFGLDFYMNDLYPNYEDIGVKNRN